MNHRTDLTFEVLPAARVLDVERPHFNAQACVTFAGFPGLRLDFDSNQRCVQVTLHGNRVVLDGRSNYVPLDMRMSNLARAERERKARLADARDRVSRAREALVQAEAALVEASR